MADSRAAPSSRPKRARRRGGARLEACGQQVRVRPERLGPVMATTCRSPPAVRRGRGPVRRPSVAHHHQVVDRRLPAPRPRSQLTIDTPFAVRSWGLDEHRELAITASSRSPSSAIFSPTRRQRPATPRRWQVTRTAARSAAPERFPPPASTSAARPGDAALHEPHVPRPRPPGSSCRAGR